MSVLPTGTKRRILDLLLRAELSAGEIAERLGVTPAAVRQHLSTLSAHGLVDWRAPASGPSRPRHRYRLTDVARGHYPKRYDLLASELIEVLLERDGEAAVLELVDDAARRLAARAREKLAGNGGASWAEIVAWLDDEFAWEAEADPRRIVVHQCPFSDVSAVRPDVCGRFFSTLIGALADVDAVGHVPDTEGFACCALTIAEPDEAA